MPFHVRKQMLKRRGPVYMINYRDLCLNFLEKFKTSQLSSEGHS